MVIVKRLSGVYAGTLVPEGKYGFAFKALVSPESGTWSGTAGTVVLWVSNDPSDGKYEAHVISKSNFEYENRNKPCIKMLIQTLAYEILRGNCNGITMNSLADFNL